MPIDEYPTPESKILVRNSIGWSNDVEMGSIPLSRQNAFHFPMKLPYLLIVERRLLYWLILMLSAETFAAPGFCLILCKLAEPACWLEGVVCTFQAAKWKFCQNVVICEYLLITSLGSYTKALLTNYSKGRKCIKGISRHNIEKAFICIASGSRWYETNTHT